MLKILARLIILSSLVLVGVTGFWLLFPVQSEPARAKESRPYHLSTEPPPRPLQAGFNIAVNQVITQGFTLPVQVTHAGDGSGRLFVVEQYGRIRVVNSPVITPFLDIRSIVRSPESGDNGGSEEGLLSLAFHPNYENNRFFYVYYTNTSGNLVIARYTTYLTNTNIANPASAQPLLTIPHPTHGNHNGGQLMFGPLDGYLYIGTGDGGSGGDPDENAQNKTQLLGKILRINVDSGSPYAIPPTNPFVGAIAGADEIWALGVRNPWRFSFDRGNGAGTGKGDLYIGDVGQNNWEEISYQAANTAGGVNFGWDCREGKHDFEPGNCGAITLTDPIAEYSHSLGSSVTGGFVYRGSQYPALQGYYFYADYGSGRIWSVTKTGPNSWSTPDLEFGPPSATFSVSAFGEDEQGEMYIVDYFGGNIRRLADANGPKPDLSTSTKSASLPHADPGETVTYTIRVKNTGGLSTQTAFLTDTIPAGLTYISGSLTATFGAVNAAQPSALRWQGSLSPTQNITITYRVTVNGVVTGSLINQAQLTSAGINPVTLTHAIFVPRPVLSTTIKDFFLPGTQPGQLSDTIPNPASCDTCHTAPIYDKWRGSMMAQAGRDPLMWSALAVANSDAGDAGEFCLRCHTPKGWFEGRSHPADGAALQSDDIHAGVACEVCHRMVDPIPSPNDQAAGFDDDIRAALSPTFTVPSGHVGSAMLILDPQDRRRGPFTLPSFPYHSAYKTDFLSQFTNAETESRLCGSCHNLENPALSWDGSRYWPNGNNLAAPSFNKGALFPIERTYDEWLNSEYASTGVFAPQFAGAKPDSIVRSCQDCHMRRTTGKAAEDAYNPVNRNCATTGCLPEHDLTGGNTWVPLILQDTRWRLNSASEAALLNNTIIRAREMLQKAATISVTLTDGGASKIATVRVTNQTGHKLPTGYPEGRRIWLNLKAYNNNGNVIYESGAYNTATGVLTEDPDIKIYEAKHGLSQDLANTLGLAEGPSFHFVLNNVILKDNRIPPRGFTTSALNERGMKPVGATYTAGQYWDDTLYTLPNETVRVAVALYYQTASKEYIDFLRTKGGVDGATLGALWDSSKSPPEVMTAILEPLQPYYLPEIFKEQ